MNMGLKMLTVSRRIASLSKMIAQLDRVERALLCQRTVEEFEQKPALRTNSSLRA